MHEGTARADEFPVREDDMNNMCFSWGESIKAYNEAFVVGTATARRHDWIVGVEDALVEASERIIAATNKFAGRDRTHARLKVATATIEYRSSFSATMFHAAAVGLFQEAVRLQEIFCVSQSLPILYEAQQHASRGLSLVKSNDGVFDKCLELNVDIHRHVAIAEGTQQRLFAEKLLTEALQDDEALDIDKMWQIVDLFKQAELLTRELDLECEAMVCSSLARIFDKVFKLESRARNYARQSLRLAEAMKPRTFHGAAWLVNAEDTLRELQRRAAIRADEEASREREPFLKEWHEELTTLNTMRSKSAQALLDHIYLAHPPKVEHTKPAAWDADNMKRHLLHALRAYHPDKQSTFGRSWQVLCEEITKILTAKYEYFK